MSKSFSILQIYCFFLISFSISAITFHIRRDIFGAACIRILRRADVIRACRPFERQFIAYATRQTLLFIIASGILGVLGIPGAPIILVAFSPIRIKLIQIPLNYRFLSLCPLIRRLPQYSIYRTFILTLLPEAVRISA